MLPNLAMCGEIPLADHFKCSVFIKVVLILFISAMANNTSMDANYHCTLSEEDVKRAKKELNEDPRNRLGAVRKLREWIEEQPHISYPTGTNVTFNLYIMSCVISSDK